MPKRRPTRIRRSETEWTVILREFASSAESARQFCARRDLALASFQRWRRRLGPIAPAKFVELQPPATPSTEPGAWSLEVTMPNGVSLRFQG